MEVIPINQHNENINNTIDQALKECGDNQEQIEGIIIVEVRKEGNYRYVQGGEDAEPMTNAEMVWHLEQTKRAILTGSIK